MNTFVQNLIDGLGNGSTYALLAVGVSMLFGVMHLVNFAHGELLTVSAYVIYGLRSKNVSWWITVPVAIVAAVGLSMAIEFTAFRRIRGASAFTLLLTSFALGERGPDRCQDSLVQCPVRRDGAVADCL